MAFYRNICVLAGTVTLVYVVMKIIIKTKKDADSTSDTVKAEEKNTEKQVESGKTNPQSRKRKLEESEGGMKILKSKPNFFIAFQVCNTKIHENVKKLQEKIIAQNPLLYPALINVPTLHVTLAVTHLQNETDIKKVKEKMDDWAEKSKKFFSEPVTLQFTGVNTFNDIVAFVDIRNTEDYKKLFQLSEDMNKMLSSAGFSTDAKCFKPHLTFLKLSKDIKLLRGKKQFKKDFLSMKECKDDFGEQVVSQLQLLSMYEPKDQNGYYKCFHAINIVKNEVDMDHSVCCKPIPRPRNVK